MSEPDPLFWTRVRIAGIKEDIACLTGTNRPIRRGGRLVGPHDDAIRDLRATLRELSAIAPPIPPAPARVQLAVGEKLWCVILEGEEVQPTFARLMARFGGGGMMVTRQQEKKR
jgi:hypothetical protein